MNQKNRRRLEKIEWLLTIRTPYKEIAKEIGVSEHGIFKHYMSLRAEYLRDEYKKHE